MIRSEIIRQKSTINYPFQLRRIFPDFLMFLEETRTLALTTHKNSQLVFACWQTSTWLSWPAWTWLLKGLNMVVDRLKTWLLTGLNMVDDSFEHGFWQLWTWLLKGFNMVVDRLEHVSWQVGTWLLTALNMVVEKLEHGCWQAWTCFLTGLNMVVERLKHGCWQAWTWLLTGLNLVFFYLNIFHCVCPKSS